MKWNYLHIMRTNIDIDDDLMAEAQTRSPGATKRAVVEEALRLLFRRGASADYESSAADRS